MQPIARPISTPRTRIISRAGSSSNCSAWSAISNWPGIGLLSPPKASCHAARRTLPHPLVPLSPTGGEGQGEGRPYALCAWRVLYLIEPVEPHRLDDSVADHDQPRFVFARAEMLMDREGWDIDEISARPFGFARLGFPIPLIRIDAVEFQIPMQIVTRPFGDEDHLFPHMAGLCRLLSPFPEKHKSLDAMLPHAHFFIPA